MSELSRTLGSDRAAPPRVLSLVQDPRMGGGIATVVSWYRRWMLQHRPGESAEFYVDGVDRGRFLARWNGWNASSSAVPHLLPRLHFPQYLAGRALLRREARAADEAHAIGAVGLQGFLAAPGTPMLTWIATTIGTERRAVAEVSARVRRASYRVSLPVLERMESKILLTARRVLVHSPYTADAVLRLGTPASAVEVVPIPIDTEALRPDAGPRRGVLFVGRAHDPRKGGDRLARLFESSAMVRARGVDVVSAGQPSSWARSPQVTWHGRVDDTGERFRRAEVLVLPSRQEGFGIVAFEALASGTPVVAYRCGGPDRWLRECGGGIVIDTDEQFRQAVERLLSDDELREEMGAAGRVWVDAHLSAKRFLTDTDIFRL